MNVRMQALVASLLALALAIVIGVGAPPSEFASTQSRWWSLEPAMSPALFAGVILAALAVVVSCLASRVRSRAALCFLASLSTATGLIIAEGISARAALGFDAACLAVLAIPAVAAVSVWTRARRGPN